MVVFTSATEIASFSSSYIDGFPRFSIPSRSSDRRPLCVGIGLVSAGTRRWKSRSLGGALRRDCLDHVLIFGERHLRQILALYSSYYNETRTHLGLGKDAPLGRAIQRSGIIIATPMLSGLHHRYARI